MIRGVLALLLACALPARGDEVTALQHRLVREMANDHPYHAPTDAFYFPLQRVAGLRLALVHDGRRLPAQDVRFGERVEPGRLLDACYGDDSIHSAEFVDPAKRHVLPAAGRVRLDAGGDRRVSGVWSFSASAEHDTSPPPHNPVPYHTDGTIALDRIPPGHDTVYALVKGPRDPLWMKPLWIIRR